MKKTTFVFLAISLISLKLFAQTEKTAQVRVGLLNGPTCVPAAYLMENKNTISSDGSEAELTFEKFADPQALLPKMIKKEIDVGFMPANVAAKVYNSGNKSIITCAVVGLGNLSLITTDENIHSFKDLKGKRVYVAGQGATPEYMFRYLLKENKMTWSGDEADVTMDFSIPTAQIAAQLISGKIQYAVVPEPFATIAKTKSDKVIAALDFQKEYLELTGEKDIYPLSVMVVRADFAKDNPKFMATLLAEYDTAVNWTIKNPAEAGALCEKHNLGLAAGIVTKAIPVSNYTFIPASSAKKSIEKLLKLFLESDKTSIGGKLPDKGFYYK
jgi:NitT/TauT family transport system substrate-binding protein